MTRTIAVGPTRTPGPIKRFARRFARQPIAMFAVGLLVVLTLMAVLAPLIATHDPALQNLRARNQGPSSGHWFGTDDIGRDLFSRMVYGARTTLLAPVIAVTVGMVLGVPTGLLAGFKRGPIDAVLGRVADALLALPGLIVAMAIVAVRGPSMVNAMMAVGLNFAPRFFRVVRGTALAIREETFIDASRIAGASDTRLIRSHVLPNIAPPLIVQATIMLGVGVLAEAALSFLGVGVQPPQATWGVLLRRGFDNLSEARYQSIPPGIAITVLILAFQWVGDGLRDSLGREVRRG
ncbi:MAG TPA: ABC transporter permease [Ilumatobacter sp.]|nr:ABC transporter permease [Ilumatobacter sp.]